MTFVLTGLDIEEKAALAERALWSLLPREAYPEVEARLVRADRPDPARYTDAVAYLTVAVRAPDPKLSRAFSAAAVQTALAGYPGLYFTEPPGAGTAVTEFWPTLLSAADIRQEVVLDGRRWPVPATDSATLPVPVPVAEPPGTPPPSSGTVRAPLGAVAGARSGDKAGNATLGLWTRTDAAYAWLRAWLTDDRLRELLPEAAELPLRRWELPHLRALGYTLVNYLGRGVAGNLHLDVQAKGLAEYLRAKHADIPASLL